MADFKVKWQAADGYVGKSRPQEFTISSDDFEADDDDKYIEGLFWDRLEDDFRDKVRAEPDNLEDFLAWARSERDRKARDA